MNIFSKYLRLSRALACSACAAGLLAATAASAQSLLFTTVAGYAGQGTNDGVGGTALFFNPGGAAVDPAGNIYVADTGNNTIRVINTSGVSSTLAGTPGVAGSQDGSGPTALFNHPYGIALDRATNIYVTDYNNDTIRKINLSGGVTTIAGTAGLAGSVNSTGTNSLFNHPIGIAVDSGTNIYVADYGNHLIRKISYSSGYVTATLAGSAGTFGSNNGNGTSAQFYEPEGVAVDAYSNVYVADTGNAEIRMVTPQGVVSTLAGSSGSLGNLDAVGTNALFYQPVGIAFTSESNIYVSDYFNNTIRQIAPGGTVVTVAGLAGTAGSSDGAGSVARFWGPQGLAATAAGSIIIADTGNSTIREMSSNGIVITIAGSASTGSSNGATSVSRFYTPENIAIDNSTNVYIADTANNVIRKISVTGVVSILAGTPGVAGTNDGTGSAALFGSPQGIAVDSSGNVWVADTGNNTIREITSGGTSSTFAGAPDLPGVYDGTNSTVQFNHPEGVAVDSSGNVYVADTWNHTIRKITPQGVSSTLAGSAGTAGSFDGTNAAARFNCPTGLAVDPSGNLFVTDYNNNTIRMVTPLGVVTTLAGWPGKWGATDGLGTNALFYRPAGIAVSSSDTLYVVDSGNNTFRKVVSGGNGWTVTTLAGNTNASGSLNGTGTNAEFNYPDGVALDPAGYIYVADADNNTIRSQGIPPIFVTQPQSQTINGGSTTTFSVGMYGSSPFIYTWQYNSSNYPASGSGALVASNAGTYDVIVTNIAGQATSASAILTWVNPPGGPGNFQSISLLANGAVQFSLTGTPGALYTLEVSTNLPYWTPLVTLTMTNGAITYIDTTATNIPTRFYMLESP